MENPDLTKAQKAQKIAMYGFLMFLNKHSSHYVLKGGTALMFFYKLNRFSEDIDLDGMDGDRMKRIVDLYCRMNHLSYTIKKDTETVLRFMLKYDETKDPLKIEVSFRRGSIPEEDYSVVNGIAVYRIDNLANMKALAYMGRDRLRDLFDVTYIINNYYEELNPLTRSLLTEAFQYKGLEHFDYIVSQQSDPLIDAKKLQDAFLEAYNKLGLFSEKATLEKEKEPCPPFAEKDEDSYHSSPIHFQKTKSRFD